MAPMNRVLAVTTLACAALIGFAPLVGGPQAQPGGYVETPDGGASDAFTEPSDAGFAEPSDGEMSDGGKKVGAKAPPRDFEPVLREILGDPAQATLTAPARYRVRLETTKGPILVDVFRAWAPRGADRFYNLVRAGFYTDTAFFRVIKGFMAQTGIHADPIINKVWDSVPIQDDPAVQSNRAGTISFATAGENTRTTQFFINAANNANLDGLGFSPVGRVTPESMRVVKRLFSGYGDAPPRGEGPTQEQIGAKGNPYLRKKFEKLDYVREATVLLSNTGGTKAKTATPQKLHAGYGRFKWGTSVKIVKKALKTLSVDAESKDANFEVMAHQVRYEAGLAKVKSGGRQAIRMYDRKWNPTRRVEAYVHWVNLNSLRSRVELRFFDDGLYEVLIRVLYEEAESAKADRLVARTIVGEEQPATGPLLDRV